MAKVVYRKSGRRAAYPLVVVGALFLFGGALLNLFWPKRTRIELENRSTARFPAFSLASMENGNWQNSFSTWMQDQFMLRDQWINTQRAVDEILFQKVEEGGILLGKDHWMFTKLFTLDTTTQKQLQKKCAGSYGIFGQISRQGYFLARTVRQCDLSGRAAKRCADD